MLDTLERNVSLYYVITYCTIMYHRGEYTKHVDPIRTTCENDVMMSSHDPEGEKVSYDIVFDRSCMQDPGSPVRIPIRTYI